MTLLSRIVLFLVMGLLISCNPPQKPNVVFILVDDLGWTDLGCYGTSFYDTPHLDELAGESIRFTNAYAASPVCSPTRASIMTGKHPSRVGITDWIPGMENGRNSEALLICPEDLHNLPLEEVTMAEVFRKEGYRTFFAGKWHLGETSDYWPLAQGFQVNKGGNHRGSPTFPGGKGYYAPYGNPCLTDGPPGEYLTDRLTDESIQFIDSAGSDPFFLYLAFYTVHTPIQGCNTYDDLYKKKRLALPDSGKRVTRHEHQGITRMNQADPKYAAMVHSMDANVGRIVEKLKSTGQYDNTILIFTSDNGGLTTTKNGGPTAVVPLRAGKGWCYEGGIRVPLLIRYPGISLGGTSCDQPAISMDFFPTLMDLAGIDTDPTISMDGVSLVPNLFSPSEITHRTLVWHYPHYHGSTWRPGSAIRSDQWKLVEFYEDHHTELYDLSADLAEAQNLQEKFPEKADSLKQVMHLILAEVGAAYPVNRRNVDK